MLILNSWLRAADWRRGVHRGRIRVESRFSARYNELEINLWSDGTVDLASIVDGQEKQGCAEWKLTSLEKRAIGDNLVTGGFKFPVVNTRRFYDI
jgi:hypothetical protein